MSKIYLTVSFIVLSYFAGSAQNVNVNPGAGSYATLQAAFTAINAGTHTGAITVDIVGNTTEAGSAILNASGVGAASYTSVIIAPSGGASRTITGAFTGHLVDLNGADNVTIDGFNTGGNSLTISNTSTGASSTIRFIGDAINNTVQNTTLLGSGNGFGVVFFSTGTATGNDGNNINNSVISAAGTNLPLNGIYSLGTGTVGIENSGITINANNISDYFSAGSATAGMNINTGNTAWTITNNKLFQTGTRTYTTANPHNGIGITSGAGYIITGNTIGYASSSATGVYTMAGAVANRFIAIGLAVGTTPATSVQGNLITAINLSTSSGASTANGVLCGINITSGNADIGNITPNTIGSGSATGALVAIPTTTQGSIVGINSSSTGTILIQNNIIGGFTSSGITAGIAGGVFGINISGAAASATIIGNTIGNSTADNMRAGTSALTTGSSIGAGISVPTTPVSLSVTQNTIQNFTSIGTGTGGYVRGITGSTTVSTTAACNVSLNTIINLSTNSGMTGYASGNVSAQGIQFSGGLNATCSQNTISNISNTNSAATTNIVVAGIVMASGQNSSVFRNSICDLANAGIGTTATTPPVVAGIIVRSGTITANVYNNMISLGTAQSTNTTFIGIMLNHGSTPDPADNVYFNTVSISGTSAGGALISTALNRGDLTATVRTQTVDIRNNIFTHTRTGGTGAQYAISNNINSTSSAVGWAANASNYNVLNATAGTVGYWTSSQTFAGWQTASASDINSFSGVPITFTSTCDLHVNMGVTPTQIESGGTAITGFTTDYDNQLRPGPAGSLNGGGTAPDIGADEFDGVPLDLTAPTIVYTPATSTCPGNRTVTATITDASGVPTAGAGLPVLYFKINAGSYTPVTGASIGSNQYTFTFGGSAVATDVVSYYIVAQDNAGNVGSNPSAGAGGFTANPPAASTPPTTPNSFTIATSLSGTKTVGAGQDYATLTAAIAAYNSACLTGPVIYTLTDATYSSETFPITINANGGASAVNTLTIKPTQAATTITGSSATGLIILNGADYITIDGTISATANTVCPVSAASRDLTLTNTNTGTSSAVIWMQTAAGADAATNNTVKNTIIVGNSNTTTLFGIGSGGATISLTSLGTGNNTNAFINNSISKTKYGIYSQGASLGNKNTGTVINQNLINTTAPNNVARGGIFAGFENNLTISGNIISEIALGSTPDVYGISLGLSGILTTAFTGNEVTNATVTNNIIGTVRNTGNSFSAFGLGVAPATSGTNLIANNMISGVSANATPGDMSVGMFIAGGTGSVTNIFHNTITMTGSQTLSTAPSFALAIAGSDPIVSIKNNILVNTQNNGTGNNYAVAYGYSSFTNLTSDHNDYFVTNPGATFFIGATGALNTPTTRATVADLQAATGKDGNAQNSLPSFVSATDLHLNNNPTNAPLFNAGTAVSVTTDIDCANRGATPDLGSDQVSVAVVAIGIEYFRGRKAGTGNYLDWKVDCSSDPSARMILERSADGRKFNAIYDQTVLSAACAQGFNYTDAAPLAGINYYRLKTISPDGAFRYSVIVALINKDKGFELISVAPNPVKTNTVLSIISVKAGKMSIAVSDMTGKVIMTQNITVIAGNNSIPMNFATLGAGTYNIRVINADNEVKSTRFVKY